VPTRLWLALFDEDEENAKLGKLLWTQTGLKLEDSTELWDAFFSVLSR